MQSRNGTRTIKANLPVVVDGDVELDGDVDVVSLIDSDDDGVVPSGLLLRAHTPLRLLTGTGDVGTGGGAVSGTLWPLIVPPLTLSFFTTRGDLSVDDGTADVGIGGGMIRSTSTEGDPRVLRERRTFST